MTKARPLRTLMGAEFAGVYPSRITVHSQDSVAWLEVILALYAVGLLGRTIGPGIWWLIPRLLLYAGGYSYVSGLAFAQARQTKAVRAAAVIESI